MDDTLLLQKIGEMINGVRDELKQDIQVLSNRVQNIEQGQERLESRIDSIERDLHETRIIVESIPKQIQLIAEQHTDIIENQRNVEDYTETKSRVSTLEHVVKTHTDEIKELKKAAV